MLELSDVMVRRSSRLQAGKYYTVSNGQNSTPVASISYYETPVRSPRRARVRSPRWKSPSPSSAQGQSERHDLRPESSTTTSRCSKTACSLLLLLFLLLLLLPFCIWFLVPSWTSVTPNNLLMTNVSVTKKLPVSDPQQNSHSNLRATFKEMFEEMQRRNAATEEARLLVFQQQLSGFRAVAARLVHRIRSLEAQNLKLTEEWQLLQQRPDGSSVSPELQQHIDGLFRKLAAELDVLANRGGSSEDQRPVADRMADFALESQGASVISSRCSQTYTCPSPSLTLFGIPLWSSYRSPRTAIQGSPITAGTCWSFAGAEGTLAVSLSHPVKITHVTVDHLSRYNSPTGDIKSAPKDLEVYGMKTRAGEGTFLGRFRYDKLGESTQTFSLPKPTEEVYEMVELRVLSNWGQKEYTCLYRFRVHGQTDVS